MVGRHTTLSSTESRLKEVSRQVFLHLEDRDDMDLTDLAGELHLPYSLVCVSVGWLVRSQVAALTLAPGERPVVRLRRTRE